MERESIDEDASRSFVFPYDRRRELSGDDALVRAVDCVEEPRSEASSFAFVSSDYTAKLLTPAAAVAQTRG